MATKSMEAVIFGVDKASATFDKVGQSANEMAGQTSGASDRMGKAWTAASKVVAVAGAAMVAAVLVKGWDRLTGIENAQAKLKGLGHNADEVKLIMDNALTAVRGTAFGLADAATVAANAVASGIKPGKDLENNLRLVADAAAIAGTDMGSMGSIFNKVAANGKLTGDVMQQLLDQGIPVLKFLSDQLGVTQADVRTMVSKGTIDFDTFSKAMEKGVGGSALAMGDTTTGALMNMSAAMGRLGANILEDVQPMVKSFADSAIKAFDAIGPPIKGLVNLVIAIPGPVKMAAAAFAAFKLVEHTAMWGKLTTAFAGFGDEMRLQQGLAKMGGVELSKFGAAAEVSKGKLSGLGKSLAKGGAFVGAIALVSSIVDGFTHVNESVEAVKGSVTDLGKQLADNNGAWDESIQKAFESSVASSDVFKALVADGADYGKTLAALTGQSGLYADANEEVSKHLGALTMDQGIALQSMEGMKDATIAESASMTELTKLQDAAANATVAAAAATVGYTDAQDDAKSSAVATTSAVAEYNAKISQSAKWQDDAKSSASAFAAAMKDAKSPTDSMKDAIDAFGRKTSDADTQLKFFSMSIDAMTGRSISMDDATKLLNDQVRNLKDTFTDATKATKGHNQTLLNVDGTINTVSASGSKLYDTVNDYRKSYDASTVAAYQNSVALGDSADALEQAGIAADDARDKFIAQTKAAGLTQKQAETLADSMGILESKKLTDKQFSATVIDGATKKIAQINALQLNDKSFTAWVKMANIQESATGGGRGSSIYGATGGWLMGGTPGVDSIPLMAMQGEALIPAGIAAANRPLINALLSSSNRSSSSGQSIAGMSMGGDNAETNGLLRQVLSAIERQPVRAQQLAMAGGR